MEDGEQEQSRTATAPAILHPLVFDWLGALPWRCPKCGSTLHTRELAPHCPRCGFYEAED